MSTKELKSIEKKMFDTRTSRIKEFNKSDLTRGKMAKTLTDKKRGKTKSEIIRNISTMSTWLSRPTTTARGYKKMLKQKREIIEKSIKYKFKDWKEFDEFGKFMNDMQERLGKRWEYESIGASKLFKEAKRLNLDTSILMKNYDYWVDEKNFKKLAKADKSDFKNLKPSTSNYTKALELPTIKKWKSGQ